MAAFQLEFNIGQDLEVYNRLLAALPPGQDNLVHEITVPSHTPDRPVSFMIKNCIPDVPHVLHITSEWGFAPAPTVGFIPKSETYPVTVALAYGTNTVMVTNNLGTTTRFLVAVTNYAVFFRAEAREIAEHSLIPMQTLDNNIESSIGYILATPLIADVNRLIPTDLEILGTLANKLLIKNLLWCPGTDRAGDELMSAFGASNPIFFAMNNLGQPETPLYRGEEHFAGFESHLWLPNREVERWAAFIQFVNNLPQLYSLQEITEGFVYVKIGNRIHTHLFDFESDFANTVLEGQVGDECFDRLFRLDFTFDAEIFINFCQASYTLDTLIPFPGLETPDTDLLAITNFRDWSLSTRLEQQFDITHQVHEWIYDSPVIGVVDGTNRFFSLSEDPTTARAVKLFLDGLLLHFLLDYRLSTGFDFRSGVFLLPIAPDPILIDIAVGEPRPFLAPTFATLEIVGSDSCQYLITAGNQDLNSIEFIISNPPAATSTPQEGRLHYLSPALPANSYGGANQYGTEIIPNGTSTFVLTFPTPVVSIGYQLFVQYAEDPAGSPDTVNQPHYIVRNHTLTTAVVEFTEVITSANAKLHWWLIEEDGVALERGTLTPNPGDTDLLIPFTNGPYLDQVTIVIQLWHTTGIGSLPIPFYSFNNYNGLSLVVQFSDLIEDSDYRLDYAIFSSQAGNLIEIFAPPATNQLVEAHYDLLWDDWVHQGPLEPVDGLTNIFTLPFPCPIPEALYATLDGRLLTQGNEKQYVVESETRIRMSFIPDNGQRLWFVYPTYNSLNEAPNSSWNQEFLTRQPDVQGAFATATITNQDLITPGDSVTIQDVVFTAIQTAKGLVSNTFSITPSDYLTFSSLGVTFVAVQNNGYNPPVLIGNFAPSNVDTTGDILTVAGHGLLTGTPVYFQTSNTLPGGISPLVRYFVVNPTVNTLQLSNTIAGPAIDLTNQGIGNHTMSIGALPTEFRVGISRDVDALSLATIINSYSVTNSKYVAVYIGDGQTEIRARNLGSGFYNETLLVPGFSLSVANISGDTAPIADGFPVGVSRELDSQSLALVINSNNIVNKNYFAAATSGNVSLSAKKIGSWWNLPITIGGNSMASGGFSGGLNAINKLPMVTYKPFYFKDAPVISLDGVSTRLYNSYSGNAVQFTANPELLQEPYMVSQVYPIDHHPMDSLVANQPCSYPKGVITQGLCASLTEIEVDIEQEGVITITVDNLPLQEEPSGLVDGVNSEFDMTLISCNGQDSMMFWIDGLFQNPTQYAYSESAGHGVITTSTPPEPGQKLWVWYLPQGDACVDEHVVQMTGVYDGVNQTFGIPNSPFVNGPAFVSFLDGLYQTQNIDYIVDVGNTTMTYQGALAPSTGQQLWGHFNEGTIGDEKWRQVFVATADGVTSTYTIPFLLSSELPTSQDSVILALDGIVQREGVDFTVALDIDSFPNGDIIFTNPPEASRNITVAYIRRA